MRTLPPMADEGSRELHEPWAPSPPDTPPAPYDIDAETPTEVVPVVAEPLPAVLVRPPPPPPPPRRRKWPWSARVMVSILTLAFLGAVGGLGYAWWKTNEDKKDLEAVTTDQSQELTTQLDKANSELATTKSSLDAATKQVTEVQGQLKTAQDDTAAQKTQVDALKALFPINAQTAAVGLPGTYGTESMTAQPNSCTVAPCPTAQLALTIESTSGALTISDPALGRVPLQAGGAGWTASGSVLASLQLQCSGSPQPTSFLLTLAPAAVALDDKNAPRITTLAGSLLLTSAAVAGVPPAPTCAPGVASYAVAANRT
jgi:hypothetical protein